MIYVFPRMTKCTFHKFGTSGNIEKHDALCILPLNIVNEKIYIFIWFWLLILGFLTFLILVRVTFQTEVKLSWIKGGLLVSLGTA